MRNIVITGGTDGIGRALALTYSSRGDRVLVIGRSEEKGRKLLEAAAAVGAKEKLVFLRADLSLIAENKRAIADIRERLPKIDALVLCARHYWTRRHVTAEGFEGNLALFYLSRFLFCFGLAETLEASESPVIANVAGPGYSLDLIRWDDLGFEQGYNGNSALGQGGKLNDLLGVAYSERRGAGGTRYILFHPGVTSTGFSGEYDELMSSRIAELKLIGKPIEEAVAPIIAGIDSPPDTPLSAFIEGMPFDVEHESFSPAAARRLYDLTKNWLEGQRRIL